MPLSLGPVKKHVRAAAEEISAYSGITNIGGWRAAGSVVNSDHPKGLAIDIMVGMNRTKGESVAAYVVANAERLSVTYIIWYERWWQNGKWESYSHPAGNSDTLAHRDHVHVSFAAVSSGIGGPPIEVSPDGSRERSGSLTTPDMELGVIGSLALGGVAVLAGSFVVAGLLVFIVWKGMRR